MARQVGARLARLEALGFDWDQSATAWETMFSELVRYKEAHGDCNVPALWSENPQLGSWVSTQRSKKDKIAEGRLARLEALGFRFST